MNIVAEYITTLPDSEKVLIINGFECLERDGVIGEEPIRLHVRSLLEQYSIDASPIIWMNMLANECYRYFAHKYFQEVGYPPNED